MGRENREGKGRGGLSSASPERKIKKKQLCFLFCVCRHSGFQNAAILGSGECEKKYQLEDARWRMHGHRPLPPISMLQGERVFRWSEKKYHLCKQPCAIDRPTLKLGGWGA